jgi:hypothetical protein
MFERGVQIMKKKIGIVVAVGILVGVMASVGLVASANKDEKQSIVKQEESCDNASNKNGKENDDNKEECPVCHDCETEETKTAEEEKDLGFVDLRKRGYSADDLVFIDLVEEIEAFKEADMTEEEIIAAVDELAQEEIEYAQNNRTLDDLVTRVYSMWQGLTTAEKKLIICHPKKAMAAYAAAQKSTEYTIAVFGHNGLGDISDGFRHVLWCAMMARDAGEKFARAYADAHEGEKTEEELMQVASDEFMEKHHRAMDKHNNEIGFALGSEKFLSNEELIYAIRDRLTNNIDTGIIWLH